MKEEKIYLSAWVVKLNAFDINEGSFPWYAQSYSPREFSYPIGLCFQPTTFILFYVCLIHTLSPPLPEIVTTLRAWNDPFLLPGNARKTATKQQSKFSYRETDRDFSETQFPRKFKMNRLTPHWKKIFS